MSRRHEPIGSLDDGLKNALVRHKVAVEKLNEVYREHLAEFDRLAEILESSESTVWSAYNDVVKLEGATRKAGFVLVSMDGQERSSFKPDESHLPPWNIREYRDIARKEQGNE